MVNTKKLFKTALEGVVSSSLAATMLLTQLNLGVRAATTPSETKFIPKSALETTDTKFGLFTGKTVQKVYFGKNPNFNKVTGTRTTSSGSIALGSGAAAADQGWYIAGYDSTTGGLVLLCDILQPMSDTELISSTGGSNKAIGGMPFLPQAKYESLTLTGDSSAQYYNKAAYNRNPANPDNELDWGCTYSSGAPTRVFANHFGGSDIWKEIKEYQDDTTRFSTAEQALMKPTTVWTWDKKNDKFYSTTSKLYLGAGQYSYNTSDDKHFFTVGANTIDTSENRTGNDAVNNGLKVGLVAATGATDSPYTIAYSNGRWFWLRSPHASGSRRCVPACALNLESVIFASAAAPAAASSSALSDGVYFRFADDTTTPKISTTATATDNAIAVTKGSEGGDIYLYIQGNDGTSDWVYSKQITQSETIDMDAIKTACNLSELTSLNNCKVWAETTVNNVTYAINPVDGTSFITQVEVKWPNATVTTAPTAQTPTYNGQAQKLVNAGTATHGTMQYKLVDNEGKVVSDYSTTIPTATNAGDYTVYYKAVGSNGFGDSAEGNVSVTISKKELTVTADNQTVTYGSEAPTTYTVTYSGFVNGETESVLDGELSFICSSYTTSSYAGSTHTIKPSGLTSSNYVITFADGTLTVNKADIIPTVTLEGWTVGGTASTPSVAGNLGSGTVTYKYKAKDADDSTYSTTVPTKAGSYTVKAEVPATTNYNAGEATVDFVVKQKMYITLKNEYGGAVTNVDGITLSADGTDLTYVDNGVFSTEGLTVGNHALTVTVEANSSYLAPEVTTYTINNDADNPSSAENPCRIIKLKQVVIKTGRVITGVGGDAGYEYDRATGKTVFYCNPAKGYKVDKIEKDSNGVVKYVSFKML